MTRAALLALSTAVLAAGCGPAVPIVPGARPVQPIALPVAAKPADPSLVAYLKLRDPSTLVDRVGSETVQKAVAARGLPVAELRAGKPGGLFAWDPGERGLAAMPAAALLPADARGAFARAVVGLLGSGQPGELGGELLVAQSDFARERANADAADLRRLLDAPAHGDAELFVDVGALMARYGGLLRIGLAALTAKAGDAATQEMTRRNLAMVLDWLDRLGTLSLAADLGPERIATAAVTVPKAGAAAPAHPGPIAVPPLAPLLAAGDVRLQFSTVDLRAMSDWVLALQRPLYESQPGALEELRQMFDSWVRLGPTAHSALSLSLAGGRLRGEALLVVEHPEQALDLLRTWLPRINAGPLHELNKRNGIDMSATLAKSVRAIEGWPVDRVEFHVVPAAGVTVPEAQAKAARMLTGTVSIEVMRMGPYVLYTVNQPLDELARRALAGRPAAPLAALDAEPAGGFLYADVRVVDLLRGIATLAGKTLELPGDPATAAPVTLFAVDTAEGSLYRAALPRALLRALADLAAK